MEKDPIDAWRQLKTHLESLRRAGLLDVPVGTWDPSDYVEPAARFVAEAEQEPERILPEVITTGVVADRIPIRPMAEVAMPVVVERKPVPPEAPPAVPNRSARPVRPPAPAVSSMFGTYLKAFENPVTPQNDRLPILKLLAAEVAACERCPELASTRTQTVFDSGSPTARLMFIGEAPGEDEDLQGEPFVGRAGKLVTDMLTRGMGLSRSEVYIANVLKCRPPENRVPTNPEMANCVGYLDRQIDIVRPEFICLLGKTAVTALLQSALPMKSLRQRWFRYRNIPTMVTYHPAYLLRSPSFKKEAWEDLKMLMKEMGIVPPPSKP